MFGFSDDMNDMFNAFFTGGPGGASRGGRNRREKRVTHVLPVTLADLYNGKKVVLARTRVLPCSACDGSGSKRKKNNPCSACRGSGSRDIIRQMGMMMQRMTSLCDACCGSGFKIDPKDTCKTCSGTRVKHTESPLTVTVEPGMYDRSEMLLSSEGDFNLETGRCGDVVVVLDQKKDDQFIRDGDDLIMTRRITLAESLCGFQFSFKHLDNRELIVRRERGEITKPGEVKVVLGEGMPIRKDPPNRGDLIIKFDVMFPERMQDSQIEILRHSLPPPKAANFENIAYAQECYVSRENLDSLRKELAEEVEEEDDGTPNVACSAQ